MMNLNQPEIRSIKADGVNYYSINDAIKQLAPPGSKWDEKDEAIYIEMNGVREPYSKKETVMSILKRLEKPPKLSSFDKILKGIVNIPKE